MSDRPPILRFLNRLRNAPNGDRVALVPQNTTEDQEPDDFTLETVRTWSHSLERVLTSKSGYAHFLQFSVLERSDENPRFWRSCKIFQRTRDPQRLVDYARVIYEDHISILSRKEIAISGETYDEINSIIGDVSRIHPYMYDRASEQVYNIMSRDSYPRFINSDFYKNLIKDLEKKEEEKKGASGS